MTRDGIRIEDRDFGLLDMCLQNPDTHQDTLASYVPKLLDEIERLDAARRKLLTVDELKALPRRSIVLDQDDITYRLDPWHHSAVWYPFDGWDAFRRDFGVDVDDIALPATLLHEGEK